MSLSKKERKTSSDHSCIEKINGQRQEPRLIAWLLEGQEQRILVAMDLFMHVIGDFQGGYSSEDLQIDGTTSEKILADTLNEIQFERRGTKVRFDIRLKDQRTNRPPEQTRQ